MTAWSNFQGPFTLHGVAAAALGLPPAKLRLVSPPDSGGSFGVKAGAFTSIVLMALASRRFGVPVRWTEDRVEHLLASSMATERLSTVEAGFTAAGDLVALRLDLIDDVGAYVRAPEPATLYRMHGCITGPYRVRDVEVRSRVVVTNRCPTGLNRGFGGPQLSFALERTMAIAAARLGLDPADVLRRNLVPASAMPYEPPPAASTTRATTAVWRACLGERGLRRNWPARRGSSAGTCPRTSRRQPDSLGVGLACVWNRRRRTWGTSRWSTRPSGGGDPPKDGQRRDRLDRHGPRRRGQVAFTSTPRARATARWPPGSSADALGRAPGGRDGPPRRRHRRPPLHGQLG